MGTAESIIAAVDDRLGHKKGKMKVAGDFFREKQNLRDIWHELDVDRSHYVTLYEIRLYCMHKADIGLNPWRFLGGMNDKTMRAAFRKTCDMLHIEDGKVPKRGLICLLKNIWLFSTFYDLFEKADLNHDEKIDRIEFSYMCKTYGLKPHRYEYEEALEYTESDERFGLGFYSFAQYALYKIRKKVIMDEEEDDDEEEVAEGGDEDEE